MLLQNLQFVFIAFGYWLLQYFFEGRIMPFGIVILSILQNAQISSNIDASDFYYIIVRYISLVLFCILCSAIFGRKSE